jgi:hypothetical protein
MEMTKYAANSYYSSIQCYNNTIVGADFWGGAWYMTTGPGEYFQPGDPYGDNDFYNNVIYQSNKHFGYSGGVEAGFDPVDFVAGYARWDHNVYAVQNGFGGFNFNNLTFAQWQAYGVDANSQYIQTNPGFVDAPNGDYRLSAGSVCIGSGKNGDNIGCYETGNEVIGVQVI